MINNRNIMPIGAAYVQPAKTPTVPLSKDATGLGLAAALFGGEGEAKIESTDSDRKFCLGVFADAIYERRNTPIGAFVQVKHNIKTPYLSKAGTPSFELKLPKPPVGLLNGVADFFRKIMKTMNNCEVMVQIYWSFSEQKYQIYVPEQEVAGASIRFKHSLELQSDPDKYWVLDIHSHNTMGAFFSAVDSADEKSTRVFGVLGRLDLQDFHSQWRAGVNGKFVPLEVSDLWDPEDTELWVVPDEVLSRVTKYQFTAATSRYFPSVGGVKTRSSSPKWIKGRANAGGNSGVNPTRGSAGNNYGRGYGGNYQSYGFEDDMTLEAYDQIALGGMEREESAWTGVNISTSLGAFFYDECLDMKDHIDDIYSSAVEGTLGTTELSHKSREIISGITEMPQFNEVVAISILDELNMAMASGEFSKVLSEYAKLHDIELGDMANG